MDFQETYARWMHAQAAAAEAEARLNRRLSAFLQDRGTLPDRKEFLEVRFLRNTSLELLEQALAARQGADVPASSLQPSFPVPASADLASAQRVLQ